jgi:hypothetical protein
MCQNLACLYNFRFVHLCKSIHLKTFEMKTHTFNPERWSEHELNPPSILSWPRDKLIGFRTTSPGKWNMYLYWCLSRYRENCQSSQCASCQVHQRRSNVHNNGRHLYMLPFSIGKFPGEIPWGNSLRKFPREIPLGNPISKLAATIPGILSMVWSL